MRVFWQVVLICGCVAIVLGVIISRIVARRKGQSGCDCGCSDCAACNTCRAAREKTRNK